MSRIATAEYIGQKRRAYLEASKGKRRNILQEVCETTGYEKDAAGDLSWICIKKKPHVNRFIRSIQELLLNTSVIAELNPKYVFISD